MEAPESSYAYQEESISTSENESKITCNKFHTLDIISDCCYGWLCLIQRRLYHTIPNHRNVYRAFNKTTENDTVQTACNFPNARTRIGPILGNP